MELMATIVFFFFFLLALLISPRINLFEPPDHQDWETDVKFGIPKQNSNNAITAAAAAAAAAAAVPHLIGWRERERNILILFHRPG
jgi:Na+-transporting methylmalonyl-CoA/oxaloacetate decarboxylase gamma subunit